MAIDRHDDLDTARGILTGIALSLMIWLMLSSL
jgi:hypothetical protein